MIMQARGEGIFKKEYKKFSFYPFCSCSHSNTLMQSIESLGSKFPIIDHASAISPLCSGSKSGHGAII